MKIKEIVGIVLSAVVIAFVINNFIVINVTIPTASMEPTLMINDRLFAYRPAYLFSDPKRGDIVVFNKMDSDVLYVKRVIGLPNEIFEINNGIIYIDNIALESDYTEVETTGNYGPVTIPEESYFMLGDNRSDSNDSRYWSFTYISKSDIKGKALIKYYSKLELLGGNDG
ncbi:MAG: signal peptidase I [Clostridiales bacterium]|nr:signal peptidase I [Clostridiales bacterium]